MKFFTVYEILISILLSAFSGILFGGIYCASESIFVFLKEMFFIFPRALKLLPDISVKNIADSAKHRKKIELGSIERNVFEAILFFLFGISVLLISYVALDGYIRLYIFVVTALFFSLSQKYISKMSSAVLERFFGEIYFITLLFISVLLWPLCKVMRLTASLFRKLTGPAVYRVRKKRSAHILNEKLREVRKYMS